MNSEHHCVVKEAKWNTEHERIVTYAILQWIVCAISLMSYIIISWLVIYKTIKLFFSFWLQTLLAERWFMLHMLLALWLQALHVRNSGWGDLTINMWGCVICVETTYSQQLATKILQCSLQYNADPKQPFCLPPCPNCLLYAVCKKADATCSWRTMANIMIETGTIWASFMPQTLFQTSQKISSQYLKEHFWQPAFRGFYWKGW